MQPSLHQPHTPEGTYPCSLYSYAYSQACISHSRRYIPLYSLASDHARMQPSLHQPHTPEGTYPCSLYSYAYSQACISHSRRYIPLYSLASDHAPMQPSPASATVHTHAAYIAMHQTTPPCSQALRQPQTRRYIPSYASDHTLRRARPPASKATPSRHSEPCIRPHPPEGAHTHHSE